MEKATLSFIVKIFCLLCFFNHTAADEADKAIEYIRSGSCNFFQECLYKYRTVQYTLGEKDREKIILSTDVHWHCESSGSFDSQPANEYCFTLSNTNVTFSVGSNSSTVTTNDHTTDGQAAVLMDKLKGEFCYVQTQTGRIVSIHYSPNENKEAVNIKRGIAGAFQANFDNQAEVEELDPSSSHISHYSYAKTSSNVVSFTRTVKTVDLIEVAGGAPKDSLNYAKTEKSTFINKILYRSWGVLKTRVDFGSQKNSEPANDTFNPGLDFGDEFQANGTYLLEKAYCMQKNKRSLVFVDIASSDVQKGSLKATIDSANFDKYRMRKIQSTIPSIPGFLEKIRRDPSNIELVENFKKLLELEKVYETSSQYTSTVSELINYYKQIQVSNKPEDVEMRKIIYSFFSVDGSVLSQKILGSALRKKLNEDERSALLYQLALIKNPSLELVNTVISSISSNDDAIILVLGAVGRTSNITVQNVAVDELLKRFNTALSSNNNDAITTLIYALGNSGSKLSIFPLLSALHFDDIDIQISSIRSLASHLDQQAVQQAIITLLPLTDEDKILEEVLKILIDAYENKVLTNPSEELISTVIKCAVKLDNPNLYELATKYLDHLNFDGLNVYLDLLKQQHNYGEVQRDHISDLYKNSSRVKRGTDWDENNSDYDVVASYAQRRSDVNDYPYHKAYIWGRTLGVDDMKLKVGAGAFAGISINSTNTSFKFYAKVVAKVCIFDIPLNVLDMETSINNVGKTLFYKIYLKQGNSVDRNENRKIELALNLTKDAINIDRSRDIFYMKWPLFLYITTINLYLKGTVSSGMNTDTYAGISFLPPSAKGGVDTKLSLTLRISGGTFVSLLEVARGGIEVAATFTYYVQPKMSIEGVVELPDIGSGSGSDIQLSTVGPLDIPVPLNTEEPTINSTTCLSLYDGWNINGEIYPYYEIRHVRVTWRGIKVSWGARQIWSKLHSKWGPYSSRNLLWNSCSTSTLS